MMIFLKTCWKLMVSVKAPAMAEPMEAESLLMGSEKVPMMAETVDSEIQLKVPEKV
jgi:hypothetical protein